MFRKINKSTVNKDNIDRIKYLGVNHAKREPRVDKTTMKAMLTTMNKKIFKAMPLHRKIRWIVKSISFYIRGKLND